MRFNFLLPCQRRYNGCIKIPLVFYSTKRYEKKPIVRRAFAMRFFSPIGQPLAPYKSRLPCGHRGCPSRTLYGENSITEITRYVKQNVSDILIDYSSVRVPVLMWCCFPVLSQNSITLCASLLKYSL